ncbi:transglutaminase-like domain-containing protein [Paracrocinitomix mangrovi]|uniref:transglutaminase-like domain-containing protein n=1 Tax=Paracrocinitomix mangrovi TaxID=2862509 RepID=UPI001EDA3849|nr:transglutaminase-like domain-containing protein [Paracrocinitomix mangrovi]UKN02872.1 transglutaminase-like domain-containing protein [Paracrocinitomix mangrovi]
MDTLNTDTTQLAALIRLVEDPDPNVFGHVKSRLIEMGKDVVTSLENTIEIRQQQFAFDLDHEDRLRDIIKEIYFNQVKIELEQWRKSSTRDLLKGALIVSKFQYPDVDEKRVEQELESIKQKVWLEINEDNTAFEIVKIFNHVLFDICGFTSSKNNFYAAENSYINEVITSRKGNPLSLSILYSVIAQKLQIPIYGVNLPNHFVLGFVDEFQTLKMLGMSDDRNILFYINPFSKGRIFDHNEIENYLRSLNLPLQKNYFEPCSNTEILKRMLTNLTFAYNKEGQQEKVKSINELQLILDS